MKTNIRLLLAVLVMLFGVISQVYAFNPQPDPPGSIARLGLLTLAQEQVLRLYAVNLAIGDPNTRAPCAVRLGFSDIKGVVIGDPHDFELRPGVGAFIVLDAGGFQDPEIRPVRPEAFLYGDPNESSCQIVISAQVIDKASGVGTTFYGDPNMFVLKR